MDDWQHGPGIAATENEFRLSPVAAFNGIPMEFKILSQGTVAAIDPQTKNPILLVGCRAALDPEGKPLLVFTDVASDRKSPARRSSFSRLLGDYREQLMTGGGKKIPEPL